LKLNGEKIEGGIYCKRQSVFPMHYLQIPIKILVNMKYKKIMIQFDDKNPILAEELICDIFFSFNLKGVVCDVPLYEKHGPDEIFDHETIVKPEVNSITGFLPLTDSSESIFEQIKEKTLGLERFGIIVNFKIEIIDEKEWSESWKKYFGVTKITDRITIQPSWKDHIARENEIVILLDPGMAFGTGTHPTTCMCIKFIEKFFKPGSDFLDIGTGSRILMITAAKLGANSITGIDNDEVAVKVAGKNLEKNSIDSKKIYLSCTTLERTDLKPYDFIAANIIAQVIVDILPEISERMKKDTIVILSGIIKERQNEVLEALETHKLSVIYTEYVDEWVCFAVKKKEVWNEKL
jgi:ribosomal protein L11 methyltransferase